ncbi:acetyl-CoA C-acyltransferase [Dactylosporangium sp. NPDC005572]|uniref:acetyl-CoA C-acyltransferase n=1 Tax=Dactylosporangium sp. NPDC005572 TaxID=3156889 RepID=UPI0033B406CC
MSAFIVAAVRTPVGKRNGGLSAVHPTDLAAHVIRALLARAGVDGAAVDDVILGCVGQVGAQASNIARNAVLAAGLPESVPGTTLDRQCGSSQQALHFAAQAVLSGVQDLVIAGGVEAMSRVPLGSATRAGAAAGLGHPREGSTGWSARYGDQEISQFRGAELIARNWGLSRARLEEFALASHQRAVAAAGLFDEEIAPVGPVSRDEGPRPDTSAAKLAALPALSDGGVLTAGVASQISDGAAALLVASDAAVRRHGLTPIARVHTMCVVGSDPVMMLAGPIPATAAALSRSGLAMRDIGVFEVNEAFAPVVLAWQAETGADPARTNPLGGAIALGHPLGATGARLMTTMVHHMRRSGIRYGLQVMCEGGGMANATLVERAPL